jgi:hypothetical protein
MAKTVKPAVVIHSSSTTVPVAPIPTSNPETLTVVVLDAKSQPVSGAQVSITPSDASAVTDSAGEVQFQLGNALKYEVTASADNKTVTVPYYITPNGATRLVVNPTYVQAVEARLHPAPWFDSPLVVTAGIGLAIVIIAVIVWKFFRRK